MNVENTFQLGDLWETVRRRSKVVGIVALVVSLAAYWVAMILPNEFQSYATVLVEPQAVDPDLVKSGVADSDLAQRLNLMTAQILSRGRLSRVIDDLGLYQEESEYMVRAEIIDHMRSQVSVNPVVPELVQAGKGGEFEINTFRIQFRDDRAKIARDVAQRLANDFIESHIEARVNVSQKSLDFIQGELDRLSQRIREVETRVASVKADNPGRLPDDVSGSQRRLDRTMSDIAFAQRRLAEAGSDEAFFRSQSTSAAILDGPGDAASPGHRIQILELALTEYEARGYTEKHPDVRKAKLEIEQLRVQIAEAGETGDQAPRSFAQQNAQAEAQRAGLRKGSAQAEIARLQARADELHALMLETPAVAEQLDGLEREYRHLFASYQDFSTRRLEAMVQAQLERRQLGEQFRVLEPAFIAPRPSSPNRPFIVLLGLIFGLAMGAGIGILLEGIDSSVHNARQLQLAVSIPVLASIPHIWLEVDRAALRRRRIRAGIATAAVVLVVLVGGAGSYVWVNGTPASEEREEEQPAAGATSARTEG